MKSISTGLSRFSLFVHLKVENRNSEKFLRSSVELVIGRQRVPEGQEDNCPLEQKSIEKFDNLKPNFPSSVVRSNFDQSVTD